MSPLDAPGGVAAAANPCFALPALAEPEWHAINFRVTHAAFVKAVARALEIANVDARDPEGAHFRLLDVACGIGRHTVDLAQRFPKAEIVGVDRDPAAIAKAEAAGSRARFRVLDAHEPLPSDLPGPFDVVQVRLGVAHFTDPRKVLSNLFGVMRPGAAIYLFDFRGDTLGWSHPSMGAIWGKARAFWDRFGMKAAGERHVELLEAAGFEIVDSSVEEHPADPVSEEGRGMLQVMVESANGQRQLLVKIAKAMTAQVFEDHIRRLRTEIGPDDRGACRMQLTFAKRP